MKPAPPVIRTRLPADMTDLQAPLGTCNAAAGAASAFQQRPLEGEDRYLQSLAQWNTRLPIQLAAGEIDIRTALGGVVTRQWQGSQPRVRSGPRDDPLGKRCEGWRR